ncbi:hypothetical protein ACWD5Q_16235 [Streptomyces sp. NPDC002513]
MIPQHGTGGSPRQASGRARPGAAAASGPSVGDPAGGAGSAEAVVFASGRASGAGFVLIGALPRA